MTQSEMHGIGQGGLKLHLYTDDGRLNVEVETAQAVPRVGETMALSGVIHEVEGVHWTWQAPSGLFGSSSTYFFQTAHVRLRAVAQEGTPGETLR